MLRMHVTQAEFRSFNEVCKQIAYACMCFLISSFFFLITHSQSPPQLQRKPVIITSQM